MSKREKSVPTPGEMRTMRMLAKVQQMMAGSEPDPHYAHLQRVATRKSYEAARPRLRIVTLASGDHSSGLPSGF